MMNEYDALADSIFLTFRTYCEQEVERRVARAIERIPVAAPGPAGRDGVDGKDGAQGTPGPAGRDGIDGKDGAPGRDGADGVAGKDGAPGPSGKDGAPGQVGLPGEVGARGEKGDPGPQGPSGKDGAPGVKGEDGLDGRDGKEGAPGRDALKIDVLDQIEHERTYPRGTFAQWQGGIIRAVRTTDPFPAGESSADDLARAGWQFVVAGISSVGFEVLDERSFKLAVRLSNGKSYEHVMDAPVLMYRGVWKQASKYARGDTVSYGNSMWHCERATEAAPGESKDWTLAVRKGADGKDGRPGKDGERGADGRPGLDLRLRPGS